MKKNEKENDKNLKKQKELDNSKEQTNELNTFLESWKKAIKEKKENEKKEQ